MRNNGTCCAFRTTKMKCLFIHSRIAINMYYSGPFLTPICLIKSKLFCEWISQMDFGGILWLKIVASHKWTFVYGNFYWHFCWFLMKFLCGLHAVFIKFLNAELFLLAIFKIDSSSKKSSELKYWLSSDRRCYCDS